MSPLFGLLIMMNNYFHDVATALLLASAVTMWIAAKQYGNSNDPKTTEYFLKLHNRITLLAKFSILWILLGGIPRVIFYEEFEWANAVGKSQVPALIAKHIMAFIFVGIGAFMWIKLNKKVKDIKSSLTNKPNC
jgi:hypothetical protein